MLNGDFFFEKSGGGKRTQNGKATDLPERCVYARKLHGRALDLDDRCVKQHLIQMEYLNILLTM